MVHIKKGNPPSSLVEFQRKAGASYDSVDFPRDDVYDALLKEQGGICAYCMCRITKDNIHIEHWVPQKGEHYVNEYTQEECDKLAIDYHNMLGVCPGGKGKRHKDTTCDNHRGNAHISVDPKIHWMVDTLQYNRDGTISSTDECINKDVTIKLNLNEPTLVANRKSVLKACKDTMSRQRQRGTWTKSMIEKQIAHYESRDKDGNRIEYAGIVLYWLKHHMPCT